MITVNQLTYDAESTDVASRVNISTTVPEQITVRLGDGDDGFIEGDFIEFLNNGPAPIVFDVKGFTTTITIDQENREAVLYPLQRAVAYYRGPDEYQWDIVTYQGADQDTAFMFHVGAPLAGHIHPVKMTSLQARELIAGTSSSAPVGDPSQPSVVLKSYPNSNPGDQAHYHELTVFFDYANNTFVVTNISNNTLDNHEAFVIGDGSGGGSGALALSELTDVSFMYPPNEGEALVFNSGLSAWEARPFPPQQSSFKPRPLEQVTIAGAYNFGSSAHHNASYRVISAVDVTVTVQPDSFWTGFEEWWENGNFPNDPGPMPDGGSALFGKHGAGNVIFTAGPGVTINTPDTLIVNRLHGKITLIKVAPNTWDIEGNLASA